MKFPILTNTTYTQAMSHIPIDEAFGGKIDIASGTDSFGRFVKAAALMNEYDKKDTDIVEYAFYILSGVRNENRGRSVVYDSNNNELCGNPNVIVG